MTSEPKRPSWAVFDGRRDLLSRGAAFRLASQDAWRFKFLDEAHINPRRSLSTIVQIKGRNRSYSERNTHLCAQVAGGSC